MGLRAASVRHPNAVVMAPALTEAGQSQNFTLPPSSPINSVSQNGGYASREDGNYPCKAGSLVTKRSSASLADGPADPNGKLSGHLRAPTAKPSGQRRAGPPDCGPLPPRCNPIMSTRPTPMGDTEDTMGIQKVGMDAMASVVKDKSMRSEMEQLLSHLGPVGGDLAGAGDLCQNVDEIMQVIKSMEAGGAERGDPPAAGAAPDPADAGDAMFPMALERELFGEVGMMGMCEEEPPALAAGLREARSREALEELQRRQLRLERRSDFLLRRLRKLQARAMGQHVAAEVAGLFEHVHRTLRSAKDPAPPDAPDAAPAPDEPGPPASEQAVRSLVRKLEVSAMLQASAGARHRHTARYFGSGSADGAARGAAVLPPLGARPREELERVSGMLYSQLSVLEHQLDSDATASSSGGESCDEMQTYNNPHQQFLSISKRAAWRYANERAAVASRWTWLQAQISDLEYRIRQHNELHRQIRSCKGAVTLGDPASESAPPSPAVSAAAGAGPAAAAVNGYRGQLPGAPAKITPAATSAVAAAAATTATTTDDTPNPNGAVSAATAATAGAAAAGAPPGPGSARTRPLQRATFRKRKLLQTTGLHAVSKKAARPSNIRCGCVPSVVPCALCTGRTDPTFPRDLPDQLTVPERVALLDPGFHPVLSFNDDISQSIHLEAIMKLPEWQQKSLRCNVKTMKGMPKAERSDKTIGGMDSRSKKPEHRRKYNRLLKSNTANALGMKKKLVRGRKPYSRSSSLSRVGKKRHVPRVMVTQLQSYGAESVDEEMESLGVPSSTGKGNSLNPSPLSHVQVVPYRRNRVNSYDIDNIVIPYSVAASTRVEKLQYKEILTPKWRIVDDDFPSKYDVKNNGIVRRVSQDSDIEDISDDIIAVRHDKCEHDEKKKFLSYIKFPLTGGRSRANRRTDSRAESSGANTPDPMSPHTAEPPEPVGSPITSPPATPVSLTTDESSQSVLRRRTVSQSRWAKERDRDDNRCNTPDQVEAVPPYDHRTFPLTDDTYEKMLKHMPEGHPLPAYLNKQSSKDSDVTDSPFVDSRAASPSSDSTESAVAEEDPNDPEWLDVERVRDRAKR